MWKALKRGLLLPRPTALRDADVSFRDWLLHAANASRSSVLIRWGVAVAISMIPVALWLVVWAIVEATDFFEYSFTLDEVHEAIFGWYWNDETTLITVAIAIVVIVSPIAFAFLTRRRVLALLNDRGRRPRCQHDATNQSINDFGMVTCSECGFAIATREVWNEHSGRATDSPQLLFSPATNLVKYFWTRRRLKVTGIVTASLAVAAGVGYGGWWGIREWRLRAMAEQARAAPRHLEASNAIISGVFTNDQTNDGPTVWTEYAALGKLIDDELRAAKERHKPADPEVEQHFFPDFTDIYTTSEDEDTSPSGEAVRLSRLAARDALYALATSGACARVDAIANLSTSSPPMLSTADTVSSLELSMSRQITRLNAARAELAIKDRDFDAAIAPWRSTLAMSNAQSRYPTFIANLSSAACNAVVYASMRRATLLGMSEKESSRIIALLREYEPDFQLRSVVSVERGITLDAIADFFADVKNVKTGAEGEYFSMYFMIGDGLSGEVGTYAQCVRSVHARFDRLDSELATPGWGELVPPKSKSDTNLIFVQVLEGLDMMRPTYVHAQLEHNAILTMLALESYRAREGAYPSSLAELLTKDIVELPVDPWSGKPLCYRFPCEASLQSTHPYVLYSTGPDHRDDGGLAQKGHKHGSHRLDPGFDFVLTRDR